MPGRPGWPHKPLLTVEQVLTWADAHHARTREWPKIRSGYIPEAPGVSWKSIDQALQQGLRGLPAHSTLARLLNEYRAAAIPGVRRQLTLDQVLAWCDAWKERAGAYPLLTSGPIPEAPGLSWQALDQALRQGSHGLPAGTSLAKLLEECRGKNRRLSGGKR